MASSLTFNQTSELLSGQDAKALLMRLMVASVEVFRAAGFRCGTIREWDPDEHDGWALAMRGCLLADPAGGHTLLLHADLGVCLTGDRAGRNTLRLSVLAPDDRAQKTPDSSWRAARKLVDIRLLDEAWPSSTGSAKAWSMTLLEALKLRWQAMCEGPNAWDFHVRVAPLCEAYSAEVCP